MRFDALDALRGLCAILVVLFHFPVNGLIFKLPVVRHGWMFVDFFFILSGFVIAHSYGARLAGGEVTAKRFMVLRVGRIYPLHLFMLALLVAMETVRLLGHGGGRPLFDEGRSVPAILTHLALLHAMHIHEQTTWNGVSWSIAAEMWAYLLFALVCRFAPNWRALVMVAVGFVSFLVLLAFSPRGLDATYDLGLARGIMGFALGVGVYAAFSRGRRLAGSTVECACLAAAVVGAAWWNEGLAAFLMLPVFALSVLAFASGKGVISRAATRRWPQFLGRVSYSIYMTHTLVLLFAFEALKRFGPRAGFVFVGQRIEGPAVIEDILVLAVLASVIAAAALTYRFVEVPGRDFVQRKVLPLLGSGRPARVPADPSRV